MEGSVVPVVSVESEQGLEPMASATRYMVAGPTVGNTVFFQDEEVAAFPTAFPGAFTRARDRARENPPVAYPPIHEQVGVVAGNYREFEAFIAEKIAGSTGEVYRHANGTQVGTTHYFPVLRPNHLLGMRRFELHYYGTWADRDPRELNQIREIYFTQQRGIYD